MNYINVCMIHIFVHSSCWHDWSCFYCVYDDFVSGRQWWPSLMPVWWRVAFGRSGQLGGVNLWSGLPECLTSETGLMRSCCCDHSTICLENKNKFALYLLSLSFYCNINNGPNLIYIIHTNLIKTTRIFFFKD